MPKSQGGNVKFDFWMYSYHKSTFFFYYFHRLMVKNCQRNFYRFKYFNAQEFGKTKFGYQVTSIVNFLSKRLVCMIFS